MADLPALLLASLDPQKRKQAEQALGNLSSQPGFLRHILQLSLDTNQDRAVRLSASVYLKNLTKTRWDEDVQPLPPQDKAALRSDLVPAMLALSSPADKSIRAQVAESISLIAPLDFPDRWPTLIDSLVSSLSPTNYNINVGVLETAHSIFNHWRSQARSDTLFTEINLVLAKFMDPFLQLFRQTASLLLTKPSPNPALTSPVENYALLAQSQVLLLDIYYDFTCQDLPPAIEDSYEEFFAANTGWFPVFLAWNPPELKGDADDTTPSLPSKIKTGILEISELFIKLYPDQLSKSPAVQTLVQGVWSLIGTGGLPSVADDHLVSQSLHFISTAIRSGYYKSLFSSKETITSLVQGVVVPNVALREHELEQFEDDPLEFIRLDLSLPGAAGVDVMTRRQAAADVLQALVGSGYEAETTEIVYGWITPGLAEYERDKAGNWRAKDAAVYMLTAIATRGSTTQHGVTSTNALVDVVKFFSDNVFQDLQAQPGSIHAILQVDAIRFLYTFRNQLTKPQLLSVLPILVTHLDSNNYVVYTYAAITIDRILSIRQGNQLLFGQADVRDFAGGLVDVLIKKIESAETAEKVAENDHLMKCVMRVIITAKQTLTPGYESILSRLVAILGLIAKNPSNPKFDQYIFESISGLMRFIVGGNPATLATFEGALFGPFTVILQQDIDQYIPYVFQILAQMLELHTASIPTEYRALLPFLLTPTVWQQKGSIPGLVKLLEAFLKRDSAKMVAEGQVASVLAVAQQRLIPSKLNDSWGFELLNAVVQYVAPADLKQYYKAIIMSLLTRMQTSKTDKYVYLFARFILFAMALPVDGLGPDYTVTTIEEIQPQLWSQILTNFVITQVAKFPHKDRKVGAVGLIRLLTQSQYMRQEPSIRSWPNAFITLAKLFSEPQHLVASQKESDDLALGMTEIDFEEQAAGYQAAYSRLAASETSQADPVGYVNDPQQFLVQSFVEFGKGVGEQQLKALLEASVQAAGPAEGQSVRSFVRSLGLGF
ncbi:importin alpha re-exporter [Pluteus cervinus]|uniref:Importin alpha re-exporter n=1 Tax=Pluteus cervinus TaxID=181527 RepID=A0ACD3B1Q2_9AGAR|nr:importin alpha re-exporter [Pluteus cervinus]